MKLQQLHKNFSFQHVHVSSSSSLRRHLGHASKLKFLVPSWGPGGRNNSEDRNRLQLKAKADESSDLGLCMY
jgi:hypothetical protein